MPSHETTSAYFQRLDEHSFVPTIHAGGAWNIEELHVAPVMGLMAHVVEATHTVHRQQPLALTRLSYDIWGTLNFDPLHVEINVLRPGRTIELVEVRLVQRERTAISLRAWLIQPHDTPALSTSALPAIPAYSEIPAWVGGDMWPGGFIASIEGRRLLLGRGRAQAWVRSPLALIAGEATSPTARAMALADIANGIAPLASTRDITFPNLDLTAHLLRAPEGEWLGFDVSVSASDESVGLTHAVLHDHNGPLGTLAQTLMIRPRRPAPH